MELEAKKLLQDVLTSGKAIREFNSGKTFQDYERSRLLRSATEREFEVIGEALNRLRHTAPAIANQIGSCNAIIAFRNRIIHGYDSVDDIIVWSVLNDRLPMLLAEVENLMSEQSSKKDSTKRFSSRVDNYVKYRPGYPAEILDFLNAECGFTKSSIVADIGSGTGKLTELFLENGNVVFGVEPNAEMREACERLLSSFPNFRSVEGTAEVTTLPDSSVDMIIAGQAFHWFDRERARPEFKRILKPNGWVVLIWNDRKTDATPFLTEYEKLLVTYATEYRALNHKNIDPQIIGKFFGSGGFRRAMFPNEQIFDFEGLRGRLLSSSYAPESGDPKHVPMLEALRNLFDTHQSSGKVALECDTAVYYGQLRD